MRLLAPLCLAAMASLAMAQAGVTKSIGGGQAGGKLLTREQLRTCLSQQKSLAERKAPLQAESDRLERDRRAFDESGAALDSQRAAIEQFKQEADELRRRSEELSRKIADFNDRARKLQDSGPTSPIAERQRQSLEREKATLDKASKDLEADRTGLLARADAAGKAYDAQLEQRNRAAADWNARNAQMLRGTQAYENDLADWKADCEGRSYREDDEKAILSGK